LWRGIWCVFMDSNKKSNPLLFHVAITTNGVEEWRNKNNKDLEQSYVKAFDVIRGLINIQLKRKIRIMTFYVLGERKVEKNSDEYKIFVRVMQKCLDKLLSNSIIADNQIKLSFIGRWYDLNSDVVETIKHAIDETKDYDNFFVNFCVNYNGHQEIVDAARLIARKVKVGKLDPEVITIETMKENLYTSNMMPPDLIIKNGRGNRVNGFLLWDSLNAHLYFSEKSFIEFSEEDLVKAIADREKV
jgi:undecaprenyl diphosphate synthase